MLRNPKLYFVKEKEVGEKADKKWKKNKVATWIPVSRT